MSRCHACTNIYVLLPFKRNSTRLYGVVLALRKQEANTTTSSVEIIANGHTAKLVRLLPAAENP